MNSAEMLQRGSERQVSDTPANRILLGQLISNGDCLYATAIARQIKQDFPGCHLTWAVSSLCRGTLDENPWIDSIWEVPLAGWTDKFLRTSWDSFMLQALERYEQGLYDFVFFTQIYPGNPHHFEGTVRPGIFLGYPGRLTVPLTPSLILRTEEAENVKSFARHNRLQDFERVTLFECSPKSDQSHVTPEFAQRAAEAIVGRAPGRYAVILCSQPATQSPADGIIDGSLLTLREMAELTRYCNLLIGCSSGISCISTSSWAKSLPMIQILTSHSAMFASLAHDYLYFGLPASHVIEMFDADVERLVGCFDSLVQNGWENARTIFHQEPQIVFAYYLGFVKSNLLSVRDYFGFCVSLRHVVDRYGWHPELVAALRGFAGEILETPTEDRGIPPDDLLQQVTFQAHALTAAESALWGYQPPSLRPETCVLSLRRGPSELEKILKAAGGLPRDDPWLSQLIAALAGKAPKDTLTILKASNPEIRWFPVTWILALIQQAEYSEARQKLIEWKQTDASWNAQLEELLGDLNWMHGDHSKALASYREADRHSPGRPQLRRKLDRLMVRNGAPSAIRGLQDLGLVLYATEPIENVPMHMVAPIALSALHVAGSFNLEVALLTAAANDPADSDLVRCEDLRVLGHDFGFVPAGRSHDSKETVKAAVEWADRKRKKWIALAPLGVVITVPVLRELRSELAHDPKALIVARSDIAVSPAGSVRSIPDKHLLAPALILMRVDWWRRNSWRFRGYRVGVADWMRLYAIKILRLAKAAYLCGAGQRLPTLPSEAPSADERESRELFNSVRKWDLGPMIRLKRFESSCARGRLGFDHDQTRTENLIDRYFRGNILRTFLARPRLEDERSIKL